jgi:hypothetical protein
MWICESTISIAFSLDLGFNRGTISALFERASRGSGISAMSDDRRNDLTHLPPSSAEEIRAMLAKAGIVLPEDLLQQFIAAWPAYEAMVRRIPRRRAYSEEPAHTYRPARVVRV